MKKKLFLALGIVLLISALVLTYMVTGCYSEGERAGEIIKFSKKGVAFKTWEGQLMQREFSVPNQDTWEFSVNNDSVAKEINDAIAKGDKVVVTYCQKFYSFPWQGDTDYFIEDVRIIEE